MCKIAFQNDQNTIKYIKVQTEELCKMAIESNPYNILFIQPEMQTEEILSYYVAIYSPR